MSVQLLDKTRKINKLLHNNNSHKVVFNDICDVLSDILASNVMVIARRARYSDSRTERIFRRSMSSLRVR
nr:hypothetical protein [Coprococcus sp. ART55/1]